MSTLVLPTGPPHSLRGEGGLESGWGVGRESGGGRGLPAGVPEHEATRLGALRGCGARGNPNRAYWHRTTIPLIDYNVCPLTRSGLLLTKAEELLEGLWHIANCISRPVVHPHWVIVTGNASNNDDRVCC